MTRRMPTWRLVWWVLRAMPGPCTDQAVEDALWQSRRIKPSTVRGARKTLVRRGQAKPAGRTKDGKRTLWELNRGN